MEEKTSAINTEVEKRVHPIELQKSWGHCLKI